MCTETHAVHFILHFLRKLLLSIPELLALCFSSAFHHLWSSYTGYSLKSQLLWVKPVSCSPASKHFLFSTRCMCVSVCGGGGHYQTREVGLGRGGVPCIFCSCFKLRPAASLAPSTPPVTLTIDCPL